MVYITGTLKSTWQTFKCNGPLSTYPNMSVNCETLKDSMMHYSGDPIFQILFLHRIARLLTAYILPCSSNLSVDAKGWHKRITNHKLVLLPY